MLLRFVAVALAVSAAPPSVTGPIRDGGTSPWPTLGYTYCSRIGFTGRTPCELILKAVKANRSRDDLLIELEHTFALSPEQATRLMDAELALMTHARQPGPESEAATKALGALARELPTNKPIIETWLENGIRWGELKTLVEGTKDPIATARQLSKGNGWFSSELGAYVLSHAPRLALADLDIHEIPSAVEGLARLHALDTIVPEDNAAARTRWALLTDRSLRGLLRNELLLPELIAKEWAAVPAVRQHVILSGTLSRSVVTGSVMKGDDFVNQFGDAPPFRLSLASALPDRATPGVLTRDAAKKLSSRHDVPSFSGCGVEAQRTLSLARIGQAHEEGFDLLLLAEQCSGSVTPDLLDAIAKDQPLAAAQLASERARWLSREATDAPRDIDQELPEAFAELQAAMKTQAAEYERRSHPPATRSQDASDPVRATVSRLLGPTRSPFHEGPLPAGVAATPIPQGWEPGKEDVPGFRLVRRESSGDRVLEIALSTRVDPQGEVSWGGYWLLESHDGGKTWLEPTYLNLRQFQPYLVVPSSHLPMLAGDTLQLEVAVEELDTASITFPPVATRIRRRKTGVVLTAPLAELRRDSDGDGLTDLLEERIVTDPHDADTDHDGIRDGDDALPQVPAKPKAESRESDFVAAVLDNLSEGRGPPAIMATPGSPQGTTRREFDRSAFSFLVGPRRLLEGVWTGARIIALEEDEMEKLQKRDGPTYGLELQLIAFSRDRRRAYVRYSEQWRGGSFAGDWKNGRWELTPLSNWIS